MTGSLLADRAALRRKLGFWRVATIIALLAAVAWSMSKPEGGAGKPHIAVVSISGMILDDRELVERLGKIAKDDNAKALVVEINSPGGSTYGGEIIYKALRKVAAKKPVVANIRTLAASAGYMIALGADRIVAGDNSITGSIGVIFQYPQVKGLLDKLGVSLEEIKSAPMKAEPTPFHAPPAEATAMIDRMVQDSFAWFVDLVAERRGFDRQTAQTLADGSIYTGRQALKLKLVDELGDRDVIKTWLKGKGVADDLDFVDWRNPDASNGIPFLSKLAPVIFESLGFGSEEGQATLKNIFSDKMFLDGLVSAWQIGRQ